MNIPSVQIVLATFNGSRYLEPLLASIQQQTFQDWQILVGDDGSQDETMELLESFAKAQQAGKVELMRLAATPLGSSRNFARLLEHASGERVFLADQDDLWLPNKLHDMLAQMDKVEAEVGRMTPILLHHDLEIIDQFGRHISRSYNQYARLHAARVSLERRLVQNTVTGCAALLNKALLQRVARMPAEAVIHDHWLALVAEATGVVRFVPRSYMLYRMHDTNVVGVARRGFSMRRFAAGIRNMVTPVREDDLEPLRQQTLALKRLHGSAMAADKLEVVDHFLTVATQSGFHRSVSLLRHGFLRSSLGRNVSLLRSGFVAAIK